MLNLFRRYLQARNNSVGTIKQRLGDIERLQRQFPDLTSLTAQQLEDWLASKSEIWAPEYNKRQRTSYRIFFRWAANRGFIANDPTTTLASIRIPKSVAKPIPEESLLSAFAFATIPERAILALGATPGLRRFEIASAHPRNRHGEYLTVLGKNKDERTVPLDATILDLLITLEKLQGMDSFYFPGRFGGDTHIHPATVYKWVKANTGGWNTHSLRHRAGSHAYGEKHDIRAVQELLGHKSIATTEIYTHVEPDSLKALVEVNSLGRLLSPSDKPTTKLATSSDALNNPLVQRALADLAAALANAGSN